MLRLSQFLPLLAALSTGIATPAALKAQDQEQPRVMLVLDGSSSMWTRVGGDVSKIEIAKSTIAALVGGWESKMEFGITTYGHREEGNCQDIETILPMAAVKSSDVIEAVADVLPRGKTPLAAALRTAAEAADFRSYPTTILLISDGIENCGQDPCATAAELVAESADLTIDIIGFDMNNHEVGQLECITKQGQGTMKRADITEFAEVMDQSMSALIKGEKARATLKLKTMLFHKAIDENIAYAVFENSNGHQGVKVADSTLPATMFNLPAGDFFVEAKRGEGFSKLNHVVEISLVDGATVEHVFELGDFRSPIFSE